MALQMDEQTFLSFYKNTFEEYSKKGKKYICNLLEKNGLITFDEQLQLDDMDKTEYFDHTLGYEKIISETSQKEKFSNFYEKIEFTKLYKYSVPLFYEGDVESCIKNNCEHIEEYSDDYRPAPKLGTSFNDVTAIYYKEGEHIFIKFVFQRSYYKYTDEVIIDYRYPIVIYFDISNKMLDIRYDAVKYSGVNFDSTSFYKSNIEKIIKWLKEELQITIYTCAHSNCINVIKEDKTGKVKIYKQMMELSSGGAAELTASEDMDYLLPFVGELRELIDENAELFESTPEIKTLLLQYLSDKEATAAYPYIYAKWVHAVDRNSFIVKVIFNYFNDKYTLLQHNTGKCVDLGMERMNNVIKYICANQAFVKGEKD